MSIHHIALIACVLCLPLAAQEMSEGLVLPVLKPGQVRDSAAVYHWPQRTVRYFIGDIPAEMNWTDVRAELQRAVREWERRTGFAFVEIHQAGQPGTIDIRFGKGDHDCPFPFKDGELAHTFLPAPNPDPAAGDMHINAAIPWSIGQDFDLYSVLLHELGHALGLSHNSDTRSVMYHYYRLYSSLAPIDVDSWTALYQ